MSPLVIRVTLLVMVALAAGASAAPGRANRSVIFRRPPARVPGSRRTRSCDPGIVLCVETGGDYAPGFQQPRFYSVGVPPLPYPGLVPRFRLLPPPGPPPLGPPGPLLLPPPPPPMVPLLPPPMMPAYPPPANLLEPRVQIVPVFPPREVPVFPRREVQVQVVPQRIVSVIARPAVSVIQQEYVPDEQLFPTYPDKSADEPAQADIRSFYQSAVMVGDGVIHLGDRTAELICDFTTNGPYPSSDILTDVVWQRLGTDGVYLNTPMTSGSENALYCPRDYVMPPPVNYDFNIVGTRTSLVIQNVSSRDYGTYRCYATRVNRLNPDDRHPVYMEIRFTSGTPRTGLVG